MANYYRGGGAAGVSRRSNIGVGNLLAQDYDDAGDFGRQRADLQAGRFEPGGGAGGGRGLFPPIERNRSSQALQAPLSSQQ